MTLLNPFQYPFEDKYFCWYPIKTEQEKWHWLGYVKRTNWYGWDSNIFGQRMMSDSYSYSEIK